MIRRVRRDIDSQNGRRAATEAEKQSWLPRVVFVLFCMEALFSLPYRSIYLSGHSGVMASIAAFCVVAAAGFLFAFRVLLLPLLGRLLSAPSIGNGAWLAFFLAFGLILRMAWVLGFPVSLNSDHLAYFQAAASLAQGHTGAGAYWPPGFSLILAPFFMVFGAHQWVAQLCALLFFAATYLLTYALASRIQGGLTARIAPMLIAIWPGYFTLAGVNCKEAFLGVLVPATILLYLKASEYRPIRASCRATKSDPEFGPNGTRFHWGFLIAAGLCMGFAALTQPGYLLFPLVVLGVEMLSGRRVLRAFGRTAVFSLALIAAVSPWTFRNYLVFHRMVLISTNGGSVFYRANNPLANGNYSAEGEVPLPKDEFTADRLGYKMADDWIVHHPGDFAALMVRKQIVFLGDDALGAYETLKRDLNPSFALYASVKGVSNLFWLSLWTVLFLGFPLLFRLGNWRLWYGLLFLPLLYQWMIDSVFESGPRHHVPYVALIAVLTGMVLSSAVRQGPKTNP
jgi:4-amino-4-deoxy-L-arabinose transferase-like glycosyltransferase